MDCKHEYYYYPHINEEGWKCVSCEDKPGEPAGFSPQLDREEIEIKVGGILNDMDAASLIHISNGSYGDVLQGHVADRCRKEERYDQYSIVLFIMEVEAPSHAKFWKGISDGIVTGNDPRDRCHCGQLATSWQGDNKFCSGECSKQMALL